MLLLILINNLGKKIVLFLLLNKKFIFVLGKIKNNITYFTLLIN